MLAVVSHLALVCRLIVLLPSSPKEYRSRVDDFSQDSVFKDDIMTIASLGLPIYGLTLKTAAASVDASVDTDDDIPTRQVEAQQASGDISDNLSPFAKQLLKRLAQLQEQLRDIRHRLQAAENGAYSNLAAKNAVVASFQGQIAAITGSVLLMSAALFMELDRSMGLNITA
ncbi:hypothetical protein ACTUVN_003697 [Pseudomonas caspiana]